MTTQPTPTFQLAGFELHGDDPAWWMPDPSGPAYLPVHQQFEALKTVHSVPNYLLPPRGKPHVWTHRIPAELSWLEPGAVVLSSLRLHIRCFNIDQLRLWDAHVPPETLLSLAVGVQLWFFRSETNLPAMSPHDGEWDWLIDASRAGRHTYLAIGEMVATLGAEKGVAAVAALHGLYGSGFSSGWSPETGDTGPNRLGNAAPNRRVAAWWSSHTLRRLSPDAVEQLRHYYPPIPPTTTT